jgi:hypothetical protein
MCFYYLPVSRQRQVWFAAIPWVILLNLLPSHSESTVGVPFYNSEAALLLMGAIVAPSLRATRSDAVLAHRLVACFAGWCALAALVGASTVEWGIVLSAMRKALLAFLTFRIASDGASQLAAFAGSVTLFVGIMGGLGWLEALSNSDPYFFRSVGRLVGGSELLAIQLSLYLPLALGFCLARPCRLPLIHFGVWIAILLGTSGLALSFSRSGWAGGILGICFVLVGCWRSGRVRWTTGIRLASAAAILGSAAIIVAPPARIIEWIDLLLPRLQSLGSNSVWRDRTTAWSVAFVPLRDSPVFGDLRTPNCYNLLLGIASLSGWPALLLWLGAIVACIQGLWRYPRQVFANPLAVGLVGGLIAFLITGIGESSLGEWVSPVFFTVLGFTAAIPSLPILVVESAQGPATA